MVADRILDILRTPFEIAASSSPLTVTASIGIAEGSRTEPEDLLRDADVALYRAKVEGKNRATVFSSLMQDVVDSQRSLDLDLRLALEDGQFFLLYQPTVDLLTGIFTGAEALLRWRHPVRGVVEPSEFLPMLESSGLIVPVGRWVLNMACRQGAEWESQHHPLTVSVNVSSVQLEDGHLVADVSDALAGSGLNPGMLILELTETTLMRDVHTIAGQLRDLKSTGVRIAIDDFGTGYSSLAYSTPIPDRRTQDRSNLRFGNGGDEGVCSHRSHAGSTWQTSRARDDCRRH